MKKLITFVIEGEANNCDETINDMLRAVVSNNVNLLTSRTDIIEKEQKELELVNISNTREVLDEVSKRG